MKYIKTYEKFDDKKFVIDDNKFQLFSNNVLVSNCEFNIEQEDELFIGTYI